MNHPDDIDPIADWIALRLQSGDSTDNSDGFFQDVDAAEDCARLLDDLGAAGKPQPQPTPDRHGEILSQFDVGRFTILRLVGRGGMGNVFLAEDPVLRRKVALKIPRLDLRGEPELRERFLREARTMAGLAHPNLVPILEIGEDGPGLFLVLAWCDGPNLGEWLARQDQPVAPRFAAELIAVLAEAVSYCHRQGIVHRDLKPSNILLDACDDEAPSNATLPFAPKITDFGLAHLMEGGLEGTDSSMLLGTPQYMAPEQAECRLDDVGPPTDAYALGVILFQMLTGRLPFQETATAKLLDQIRREEPPAIGRLRRDVPKSLQVVCEKCLQKRSEDRYASVGDLAADLRRFLRGEPILARPIGLMTKLDRWLQRPQRLYNAAFVTIVFNLIIIAWMAVSAVGDLNGSGLPLGGPMFQAVARVVVVAVVVHGLPIVLAILALRRRRWALVAATAMAAALWLWITAVLLGAPAPFPGYDEQPALKLRVFSLLEALTLLQFTALLLAQRVDFGEARTSR